MLSMQVYSAPTTLNEAYDLLHSSRNNVILGGCAFLRLGKKRIGTGVDLKKLNLDYIRLEDDYLEIGAMTHLRSLETHRIIQNLSDGILSKAISSVVGVSFRNTVTLGGSVYGKYGFSDVITALLALDAKVFLHKGGVMNLEEFLNGSRDKDILTSVRIPLRKSRGSYVGFRHSAGDFPILTVAVTYNLDCVKIVVGARPMGALLAKGAMEYIKGREITRESAAIAADIAINELVFGSNMRSSAKYRRELGKTLIERSLLEVCRS
ncbi:MAG: FAD binding domain-containing protein [Acidaminobacteraceae bacterium]